MYRGKLENHHEIILMLLMLFFYCMIAYGIPSVALNILSYFIEMFLAFAVKKKKIGEKVVIKIWISNHKCMCI